MARLAMMAGTHGRLDAPRAGEVYALLLDVYRQAMEQERIPQRTPAGQTEDMPGASDAS